ncbi:MAG: hypothetical protein F2681_14515 [Actinobacteria bacterium]|nr:hypothetical protein [Actinomycetota bacterium]MSW78166.1 hypothetical protein [Actinomycetota bacterium]MSX54355.1 hypothetical protein [Actinomycetota bacterium]MSZ84346.1 hypothetical protein [Actinomycetota bacterium]MTB18963.1 hypothetical protein [Actinomycetota bacterium]
MTTEAATSRARAAVIEIVGRAPVPPTAADLDLVAVVTLHRQPRVLLPRTVAAGAVLLVIGGVLVFGRSNHDARTATTDTTADGSSGTLDELRTDARRYAETFLRGTADDINSWHSSSCTDAITPDELVRVRAGIQQAIGSPADSIAITGTQVRDLGGGHAQASVTTDLPPAQEGNDNWINYQLEAGRWRVVDCTMLPFGGHSTSTDSTAT